MKKYIDEEKMNMFFFRVLIISNIFLMIGDAGRNLIWDGSSIWESLYLPKQFGKFLDKFIAIFFLFTSFGLGKHLIKNTSYLPEYLRKSLLYIFIIQCLRNIVLIKYADVNLIFEHTIQVFTPFILFLFTQKSPRNIHHILEFIRWSIFFTFLGHGLYALGFPYQPPHFIDMVSKIWRIEDSWHISNFLKIAGFLDMLVCIALIRFNNKKQNTYFLVYATLWGFFTALARLAANFSIEEGLRLISFQWWFEFLLRLPHSLFPFLVLLSIYPKHILFHYFSKDKMF
ncbi:MAG: hypothetical protein OHK0038_00800 [Flammeovirgaceae bacterium]